MKEALHEWDMSESEKAETPGMTDEYDLQSYPNGVFHE